MSEPHQQQEPQQNNTNNEKGERCIYRIDIKNMTNEEVKNNAKELSNAIIDIMLKNGAFD